MGRSRTNAPKLVATESRIRRGRIRFKVDLGQGKCLRLKAVRITCFFFRKRSFLQRSLELVDCLERRSPKGDSLVLLAVRLWILRTGAHFIVSPTAHQRFEAIVLAASSPQRHVWRARIILLSADAIGTGSIMVRTGKSKTCV